MRIAAVTSPKRGRTHLLIIVNARAVSSGATIIPGVVSARPVMPSTPNASAAAPAHTPARVKKLDRIERSRAQRPAGRAVVGNSRRSPLRGSRRSTVPLRRRCWAEARSLGRGTTRVGPELIVTFWGRRTKVRCRMRQDRQRHRKRRYRHGDATRRIEQHRPPDVLRSSRRNSSNRPSGEHPHR